MVESWNNSKNLVEFPMIDFYFSKIVKCDTWKGEMQILNVQTRPQILCFLPEVVTRINKFPPRPKSYKSKSKVCYQNY